MYSFFFLCYFIYLFICFDLSLFVIKNIFDRALPGKGKGCQILLFSATYNEEVAVFAEQFVMEPKVSIRLERKELSVDKLAQYYMECDSEPKRFDVLSDLYCYLVIGQSIIFVEVNSLLFVFFSFILSLMFYANLFFVVVPLTYFCFS